MRLGRHAERGFVARVNLDEPLTALEIPSGHELAIVVVQQRGVVIGQIAIPARPRVEASELATLISADLWPLIARTELREALRRQLAPPAPGAARPSVAVVVCTRDRPEQLRDCVESLLALRTPADEILVVDNAPSDERTRELCEALPVRYVREPLPGQTRARNRGILESRSELVAYTDDDCIVDPAWLDSLPEAFEDPLTMVATGYIGPYELGHPAQLVFERHMGFERHPEPRVLDPRRVTPVLGAASAGAGANMVFRREAFERIGLFAEDLGPGTPARSSDDKYAFYRVLAAGFRIRYDPARIVWHRHRADAGALRRIMEDYGVAEFAYSTRLLLDHGELGALHIWRWWLRHYAADLRRAARRTPDAVPLGVTLAELGGALRGPRALRRSARSREQMPPLELPAPAPAVETGRAEAVTVTAAEAPHLTVAIASRNRRERLAGVLAALARQQYPADRFEVTVVLDGTEDDSAAMVAAFDAPYALRAIEQEHRGLAATRNHGARDAGHPLVVFLDDDIEPVPGWLAEHAAAHREAATESLVMGAYPPARLGDGLWEVTVRAWWTDHFRRKARPDHRWSFADFIDGNASVPRALFERLGGFDERFTGGRRQDWELGVRLLAAGVPFEFRPQARGDHLFDTRLATGLRNARQEGRYDVLIARKHPEVKWQLPLARFRFGPGQDMPRALRLPAPNDAALAASVRAADGLERLRQRRRWARLVNRVLLLSYVAGVRDAVGSNRELSRFLEWDGTADGRAVDVPLGVAPAAAGPGGVAPQELVLRVDGAPLARVPAMGIEAQWDPEEIIERIVDEVGYGVMAGLARSRLGDGTP